MPTTYTIHLKNMQKKDNTFWCFLDLPVSEIAPEVYANSSANLTVSKYKKGQDDSFSIPLQYVIKAGASNQAVELNTRIQSSIVQDTDLGKAWHDNYNHPNKGPSLYLADDKPTPANNEVDIWTNNFDKDKEPLKNWYSNLTFGVQSQNGFMGVTWSPDPSQRYRIEPKVQFYVATGSYESNQLADITAISATSASIDEDSFDGNNECTVTLKSDGNWIVEPGNTNVTELESDPGILSELVKANVELATAHAALVAMYNSGQTVTGVHAHLASDEYVKSTGIKLRNNITLSEDDMEANVIITGTITVATAISAAFLYMIASGITLRITRRAATGLEFDFSYSGSQGAEAVRNAFAAGQLIDFRTA